MDADYDGVVDEIMVGEISALSIFLATMDRPLEEPLSKEASKGFRKFMAIGCADCHIPEMETQSKFLSFSFPEVPQDPGANVFFRVDLTRKPAKFEESRRGGIIVRSFSDFKRHNMGPGLAEDFHGATAQQNQEFITARLWGVADTAPYLHDGRALTLGEAIMLHGGEATEARDKFARLRDRDKGALLAFLRSLRTPNSPNNDVVEN